MIQLSDGTLVHLNVSSRLCFPACFNAGQRVVELTGEAYFEVTQYEQQLFVVRTKGLEVKFLGKLNISNYPDSKKAEVSVLKGRILFCIKNEESSMQGGQALIVDLENGKANIGALDKRTIEWRNGTYFFNDEALSTICTNAYRLYGVHIIIEGPLANRHFTGSINRKQPLEDLLDYLRDTGNVAYYKDAEGQIHLRCPNN